MSRTYKKLPPWYPKGVREYIAYNYAGSWWGCRCCYCLYPKGLERQQWLEDWRVEREQEADRRALFGAFGCPHWSSDVPCDECVYGSWRTEWWEWIQDELLEDGCYTTESVVV